MSRKCKRGQRARIIGGRNAGKIVLIVRPYFYPQIVNDASWPMAVYPWVVTSLSGPLRSIEVDSGKECPPTMTIVADDPELEPLDDDDGPVAEESSTEQTGMPKKAAHAPALSHA